ELATETIERFIAEFDARFLAGMRRKIGLSAAAEGDAELVRRLLASMEQSRADFTLTFRRLALAAEAPHEEPRLRELFEDGSDIASWLRDWRSRLQSEPRPSGERAVGMLAANPAYIPRNHRVQAALDAAEAGDYIPFRTLVEVLQHPFDAQPDRGEYAQ